MADKWPLANGNWSNAANWDGGTKPVPGDDVFADGWTVTIDENIDVASIRTTQRSGGTAGGSFTCSLAGTTITADVIAGTSIVLNLTNSTGVVTLNGNVTASTTNGVATVTKSLAGGLTHVGNGTGGSGGTNSIAIQHIGGSFNGTGNYSAGASFNSWGLQLAAANQSHTVVGNAIGNTSTSAAGILVQGANTTLVLTGSCIAATTTALFITAAGSNVTISGDVTGGSGVGARGVFNQPASTVTIAGNAIGGTNATPTSACYGADNSGAGTLIVQGYAIGAPSGGTVAGVFGSFLGSTTVGSVKTSAAGIAGIQGKVFVSNHATATLEAANAALEIQTYQSGGGSRPVNPFTQTVIA